MPAPEQLAQLASDLECLWNDPQADMRLKNASCTSNKLNPLSKPCR